MPSLRPRASTKDVHQMESDGILIVVLYIAVVIFYFVVVMFYLK